VFRKEVVVKEQIFYLNYTILQDICQIEFAFFKTMCYLETTMETYSWIRKNFSKLVNRYGGEYVVIAGNKVFSGKNPKTLEKEARQKHPAEEIVGMPVPKPEEFTCAL